jgi:acyl transferase domain-containing protein/acyl carrier protein
MHTDREFQQIDELDIAIIGLAGRFPKAKDLEEFWQNLQQGREAIAFFSEAELIEAGVELTTLKDLNYVKAASLLETAELFDASFFDFSPREALVMDPQHRLFLECSWQALENAGYNPETYQGGIGVYAGQSINTYLIYNIIPNKDREPVKSAGDFQLLVGNDKDFLSTHVSYKLNLKGPSLTVQTACSTSLVAIHLACQSLLTGESEMALAGGVSVRSPQKAGYIYQPGNVLSPDGHCRAFDAQSEGTIFGSGVGIVILKRLVDAIVDRDHIYAVIKGSAINNDGSLKIGYTAPSVQGQTEVVVEALANAGIEADSINYIEAHGTGTSLGDPIEIASLTQAFRTMTDKKGFCAIGSLKSNIGHLDAAAGVAGVIKTVLALQNKLIPPSINFEQPNPKIDFANSPFYVNTKLNEWKQEETPRRAGVNSLGIGGTNAHLILEEAPAFGQSFQSKPCHLLVLSAKTETALTTASKNFKNHLQKNPELNLADVAYTLQVGRQAFNYRQILIARNLEDAVDAIESQNPQNVLRSYVSESKQHSFVFMFPGQGSQYVQMGAEIYQYEPIFREQVDLSSELLKPYLGLDLREMIYPTAPNKEQASQLLKETRITQPALFVIEYALAKLWMSWGIQPQAMIGHSVGEYVAACLAGVFSLKDALFSIATRSQLMQNLPAGAMLAVPVEEIELQNFLTSELSLAAINTPSLSVVSGPLAAIDKLEQQLIEKNISARRLHTSHAFHSQMMSPMLQPFVKQVERIRLNPPQIPYISNVTGTWIKAEEATEPEYWANHIRQTVRFAAGLGKLLDDPEQIFLEVGPGWTLSKLAQQNSPKQVKPIILSCLPHPQNPQSDLAFLLKTVGQLWLTGIPLNWSKFYGTEHPYRVPLPTYPFERQRYWIDAKPLSISNSTQFNVYKNPDPKNWFYLPSWKRSILPSPKTAETQSDTTCLIFSQAEGLSVELLKQLKLTYKTVIEVLPGEQFSRQAEGLYTLNPCQPQDYQALIQELNSLDQIPTQIVHLWSLTNKSKSSYLSKSAKGSIELFEKTQNQGFRSLLFLVQALSHNHNTSALKLLVISDRLNDVSGQENLHPEKATLLGLCKVIPQEYSHITCRCLDLDEKSQYQSNLDWLSQSLVAELNSKTSDVVVAYRGNHRWVESYEATIIESNHLAVNSFRQGGVYLIIGGFLMIGLVIAEYLAKNKQAKLIMLENPDFPQRKTWTKWLATHDQQNPVSRKINKVLELEQLGAEVSIVGAALSDEEQMRQGIEQAQAKFGDLNGVIDTINSYGLNRFLPISEINSVTYDRQFQPLAHGLLVLEKVLAGKELDFCLLFGSLTSILGGLGLASYAAASSFMAALTNKHNRSSNQRWMVVNWDAWTIEWEPEWHLEGIDEQITAMLDNLTNRLQPLAITIPEGIEVLERILPVKNLTQIVVATNDLQDRLAQWVTFKDKNSLDAATSKSKTPIHARPNVATKYVAPRNSIEEKIALIFQELLGLEKIGIHDSFFDLGGHSLSAIQLISKLNKELDCEFSIRSFFEHPTIADLAQVVMSSIEHLQ